MQLPKVVEVTFQVLERAAPGCIEYLQGAASTGPGAEPQLSDLAKAMVNALPELSDADVDELTKTFEAGLQSDHQATMDAVAKEFLEVVVVAKRGEAPEIDRLWSRLGGRCASYCGAWLAETEQPN